MIRTYDFSFKQLSISATDLQGFIGYKPGSNLDALSSQYEEALQKSAKICRIRAGYRLFSDIEVGNNVVVVEGTVLSVGEIIASQLQGCSGGVVFVCTAGHEISELPRNLTKQNDALMAYLYDVIGSVCAEKAADQLESILQDELGTERTGISNRCSPGYCGWDVADQEKLFVLLPENFCGVSLSETAMMDPIKSVSGIIGYGQGAAKRDRPCKQCSHTTCKHNLWKNPLISNI